MDIAFPILISTHSPNAAQRTAPRPPFAMLMGHEYLGAPEAEARVIVCHPGGLFKVRHRNHQILNAAVDTRISGMLRNTRRRSTTKTTAREQKKQSPRGAFRADSSEGAAPVGGASGRQYARTALQIFVGTLEVGSGATYVHRPARIISPALSYTTGNCSLALLNTTKALLKTSHVVNITPDALAFKLY